MDWTSTNLTFKETGYFSRIITDYLDGVPELAPFYKNPPTAEGFRNAIEARKKSNVDRNTLVTVLQEQYAGLKAAPPVNENIERLGQENTFTVCTAHQPAIFTGHLYFVYKILHTIRLAQWLSGQYPDLQFVPVFYMGSEDADLEELGYIYLGGDKLVWNTKQTGAVGRMKTKGLDQLLHRIEGELSVLPFGRQLMELLRPAYADGVETTVQTATLRLLHSLFAEYGLVVLNADDARLKRKMIPVFGDDLFKGIPSAIVGETISRLDPKYKVQANPRAINLFYLKDDLRGRIEKTDDGFIVHDSTIRFTEQQLRQELVDHPERFSPNVILRGLYQETILPNLAFIGGGGETAYWLEYKDLFDHYHVPFPLLILRNSFELVPRQWAEKFDQTGFKVSDLFQSAEQLVNELVRRDSGHQLSLEEKIAAANDVYEDLKALARPVDPTLEQHVEALQAKAVEPLKTLEKKLLKAEKRKFGDQQRQVHALKAALFPHDELQERVENFMPYYAKRGPAFIHDLYTYTPVFSAFVVLFEGAEKV